MIVKIKYLSITILFISLSVSGCSSVQIKPQSPRVSIPGNPATNIDNPDNKWWEINRDKLPPVGVEVGI